MKITNEQLAEIEARAAGALNQTYCFDTEQCLLEDVPALVAEVRRLRAKEVSYLGSLDADGRPHLTVAYVGEAGLKADRWYLIHGGTFVVEVEVEQ